MPAINTSRLQFVPIVRLACQPTGVIPRKFRFLVAMTCLVLMAVPPLRGAPPDEDDLPAPSTATRLKFLQEILRNMRITSTADEEDDTRELKFQMTPLLRYNDPDRGIADSVIFRLGTRGRPIALVTAELYDRNGRQFLLNHEFLAIDNPRIRLQRDVFRWEPPAEEALRFQTVEGEKPAADNPRARLARFKLLAAGFSAHEEWGGQVTKLRLLPTPIDRYVPSDKLYADAVIFAFVTGVNPEALLFLETDGKTTFVCVGPARGAAAIEAKLEDRTVWGVPRATLHEHPTAGYTSIHRSAVVPLELETPDKEEKAE